MSPSAIASEPILAGLTTPEAEAARAAFGANRPLSDNARTAWRLVREVVSEPMFLLLAAACGLYGLLGQWQEGAVLAGAMGLVAGISVFQAVRSDRALQALRRLARPTVAVLRDGVLADRAVEELVVGDVVRLTEGLTVPADGTLLRANDCAVDEAVLTGESVPVPKTVPGVDVLLGGTLLVSGSAYVRLTAVGEHTEMGRLGLSLHGVEQEKTPLQQQTDRFVRRMAGVGVGAFGLVWAVNFARSGDWAASLLLGLTIAMAVLPEEIPVAFSSFMAIGAARMVRFGVLTKQPQTVESLGSATVICTDKTGTLTQDGMTLARLYDGRTGEEMPADGPLTASGLEVLAHARWASEPDPFDPMERAIVAACQGQAPGAARALLYEYPLGGTPPMMTHVYADGPVQVAGKGAVERIVRVCRLAPPDAAGVLGRAAVLAAQGYRVLGVAGAEWPDRPCPAEQDDFPWVFTGLVALENPPKPNAADVVRRFGQAGITVKMVTGDSPETALAIARQVGLPATGRLLTGREVMDMPEADLRAGAARTHVFARMFPEAKLRVVRALKANGEVVGMTGDGVNDAPALKAAHIGVAMGRRGTEVAKQAASLVLVNDDLGGMVDAIGQGRRIYQNLKQAVGYIVAIHIPIILSVTVPLLFGWRHANIFSPVHIIFFELVMGPTCSIAFENEPAAPDLMRRRPRPLTATFFTAGELGLRVGQGLAVAVGVLAVYGWAMQAGLSLEHTRTLTFVTLVLSNIWLTLVVRSDSEPAAATLRRPNPVLWGILSATTLLLLVFLAVPPVRGFFGLVPLSAGAWAGCGLVSLAAVGWVEGYKAWRARRIR